MTRRVTSPELIGREAELGEAAVDLDLAARGSMSVILVGGEAGIGKTRLAAAITELAAGKGFRTIRGGCVPVVMGTLPYGPFTQALGGLALALKPDEVADVVAGDAALVARIAPGLAGPSADPDPVPVRGSRTRLLEAIAATLRRLATRAPVLLIVEDLHWADPDSLDVLSYVAQSQDPTPMAILLTFRSEEIATHALLEAWLAEFSQLVPVHRIELGRLARDESGLLIESIRGSRPASRLVDSIHWRSGGNPFLIEELLLASSASTSGRELAPILGDVLTARLDSSSRQVRRVLGLLAVGGPAVDDELLGKVAEMSGWDLAEGLHEAIAHGHVVVEHGRPHDRVRFRHELLREVAYERLLAPERRSLHRAFAQALEPRGREGTSGPGHWAQLARHWHAAGDVALALPAAIRAGAEAERAFAFRAALGHYQRALADWDTVERPDGLAGYGRLDLLRRAANAAFLSGAGDVDLELRRRAVGEADHGDDPEAKATTRAELGHSLWACGEAAESEEVFRAAVALLPAELPTAERARALAVLGQVLMNTGRYRESLVRCEEALAIARVLADRSIECHASNSAGVDLGYLGRCGEALDSLERSRAMALEIGDPDEIGRAYLNETEILTVCGQRGRALELVDEGVTRCRQVGVDISYGQGILMHGCTVAFELGEWTTAAGYAREWTYDMNAPNDELYLLGHTVELEVARGTWDEAERRLARMSELLARYPVELQYTGPWATARAELALWQCEPAAALDAINAGLTRLERTDDVLFRGRLLWLGLRAAADLAAVARARHNRQLDAEARRAATEVRHRVLPVLDVAGRMEGGLGLELAASRAEADAEESRLRGAPDPDLWHRIADEWVRLERPYPEAYARWREAEAHLQRHHRAAAGAALGLAAESAADLGAKPLAREISGLGRRSRLGLARSSAPSESGGRGGSGAASAVDRFGLTPRELEVLELLGGGLTDRQIGEDLFISHYTASIHVSRILAKLGVSSRTEAAGNAYRLGLIRGDRVPAARR